MNHLVAGDIMMARIKELETELAELKANLPQIKYDAIMDAIRIRNGSGTYDIANYAKNVLAQAKEQSE